ncbi:tryptophan-rich sensory protein [Paenibacillus brasilensis]|uniref:Tryptophan-rich sensory protein n=1 Tax=Paenibacillus brasilensis TaxID=128574 RepID=A0ABU0L6I3_9BACL|nr:tryptophan-rich sensory protein [Paenibacillus brasilensis]
MLKKLKNPIFLILIIFLATLTVRIVYNNPPHYIYDWLMGIYAIRLISRTLYEKYQNKHRTSIVTDTVVEVIMVLISVGIILFLIMSQETWMHKLLFLIGETHFLIYSGYIFKEIIQKNRGVN